MREPGTLEWRPKSAWRILCAALLCFGLVTGVPASSGGATNDYFRALGIEPPAKKVEAPDFTLPDPKGRNVRLRDFRGKVVLLNFWATWCGPCRVEMPEMEKLYREFKDQGFAILAVDLNESPREVLAFVEQLQLTFPVVIDKEGNVSRLYAIRGVPVTFLINRQGKIIGRVLGPREWASETARGLIQDLLASTTAGGVRR